jgi:hypothetical protein
MLRPVLDKFENFKTQIAGVATSVMSVTGSITDARLKIASDVSGMITAGIKSATDQAAAASKAVADEALANHPVLSTLTPGSTVYGAYGGGRCSCRCKCNRKTRRKKKAKRSKTRIRKS